jgi:hypothetical protein
MLSFASVFLRPSGSPPLGVFLPAVCKFLGSAPKFGGRKRSFRLKLKLRFSTPKKKIEIWSAEAELPPDAEASLQHSKKKLKFGVRKRSFRLKLKLRFSTPKKLSDERYRS